MRPSVAVARCQLKLTAADPIPPIISALMAVVLAAFLKPSAAVLTGTDGTAQVVAGTAAMFGFSWVHSVSASVFSEHGWHTWDRLRTYPLGPGEVLVGKLAVPWVLLTAQTLTLFALGSPLFGLSTGGRWHLLIVVAAAMSAAFISIGLLLVSLLRSFAQVGGIANLSMVLFAGVGGAIVPHSALPDALQHASPAVPFYWSMRGFKAALAPGSGDLTAVLASSGVLLGFAAAAITIAASRFSMDKTKTGPNR